VHWPIYSMAITIRALKVALFCRVHTPAVYHTQLVFSSSDVDFSTKPFPKAVVTNTIRLRHDIVQVRYKVSMMTFNISLSREINANILRKSQKTRSAWYERLAGTRIVRRVWIIVVCACNYSFMSACCTIYR